LYVFSVCLIHAVPLASDLYEANLVHEWFAEQYRSQQSSSVPRRQILAQLQEFPFIEINSETPCTELTSEYFLHISLLPQTLVETLALSLSFEQGSLPDTDPSRHSTYFDFHLYDKLKEKSVSTSELIESQTYFCSNFRLPSSVCLLRIRNLTFFIPL